jgi:hypothetical protein
MTFILLSRKSPTTLLHHRQKHHKMLCSHYLTTIKTYTTQPNITGSHSMSVTEVSEEPSSDANSHLTRQEISCVSPRTEC